MAASITEKSNSLAEGTPKSSTRERKYPRSASQYPSSRPRIGSRLGATGEGGGDLTVLRVQPVGAGVKRRGRDALRVVVKTALFLPDVETGPAGVVEREFQIAAQQRASSRPGVAVEPRAVQPAKQCERAQGRTVVLRPRPAADVQAAVRIDAGLLGHPRAVHFLEFAIGSQEPPIVLGDAVTPWHPPPSGGRRDPGAPS